MSWLATTRAESKVIRRQLVESVGSGNTTSSPGEMVISGIGAALADWTRAGEANTEASARTNPIRLRKVITQFLLGEPRPNRG